MAIRARVLRAWLWVALCIAAILTMSGEAFSGSQTSRFLHPLLRWLFPEITVREIWRVHVLVRKGAHLTEYAVLAMLSLRALRLSLALPPWRIAGLALAIVLAVAGFDELRQSYLPARTGSLGDVAINLSGGTLGVLLVVAVHRWFGVGTPAPKGGA
jgi:VanZ family protein